MIRLRYCTSQISQVVSTPQRVTVGLSSFLRQSSQLIILGEWPTVYLTDNCIIEIVGYWYNNKLI